jgi:D-sedoheptulose 7-phosphate isomerase
MSRDWVCDRLLARNRVAEEFFPGEARRLAEASRRTAERFLDGGRLIAFGRGPYATDAQHVAVEFIHPIVVGKRALPALDLSHAFAAAIATLAGPVDVVMGFGPPAGDAEVVAAVELARRQGALTFALPGEAEFAFRPPTTDPFAHQELIEVLYHTLWETVHVFLEHRQADGDAGAATFLYPFLGGRRRDPGDLVPEVAASILTKVRDDARLREAVARDQADGIVAAAEAIADRLRRGGKAIVFGNGGSATDANDLALDCLVPPPGFRPIPAISLAAEPATVSALANDVGSEVIFLRQLLPHLDPRDVVIGISTSGGSANVIAALAEARKRDALAIGLLGYDGGEIARRSLVDHALVVPCDYVPRIQEVQASIYHVLREALEELLP